MFGVRDVTATQAKIAGAAALALLAWWLTPKPATSPIPRVSKELDVRIDVNDPWFGYTEAEIARMKAAGVRPDNPAVDPDMRRLIDASNILIAEDTLQTTMGVTPE